MRFTDLLALAHAKAGHVKKAIEYYHLAKEVQKKSAALKEKFSNEDLTHYRVEIWTKLSQHILDRDAIQEAIGICFNQRLCKELSSLHKAVKPEKKALNDQVEDKRSERLQRLISVVNEKIKNEQMEEAIALCKKEFNSPFVVTRQNAYDCAYLHYLHAYALTKRDRHLESIQECEISSGFKHSSENLTKNTAALKAYDEGKLLVEDHKYSQAYVKFQEALRYRSKIDSVIKHAIDQLQKRLFPASCSLEFKK